MIQDVDFKEFGEKWAENLTVPYRVPEPIEPKDLSGFSGFKARLSYMFNTSEESRPTGLENVLDENFVIEAYKHEVFYPSRESEILLTADWDQMINSSQLYTQSRRTFLSALRKELEGQNLIELGAGTKGREHKKIFKKVFGVKSYTAVDIREEVKSSGGIQSDVLQYLQKQNDSSAIICAFGLFNEPLSPINQNSPFDFLWPASLPEKATRRQWEHEYLRRLAKEISRVTPNQGILFGDGIHPINQNFALDYYLQGNGFAHQGQLYSALVSSKGITARQPFFMRKNH